MKKKLRFGRPLPGNNCGGCGYPGCDWSCSCHCKRRGASEPLSGRRRTGRQDHCRYYGTGEAGEVSARAASVKCKGTCDKTKDYYQYTGVEDCEMMAFVPNGGAVKMCTYGCLGFGSCVKVCPFDAIDVIDGVAVVDREACKACGQCVAKCPRHLIQLISIRTADFCGMQFPCKG